MLAMYNILSVAILPLNRRPSTCFGETSVKVLLGKKKTAVNTESV